MPSKKPPLAPRLRTAAFVFSWPGLPGPRAKATRPALHEERLVKATTLAHESQVNSPGGPRSGLDGGSLLPLWSAVAPATAVELEKAAASRRTPRPAAVFSVCWAHYGSYALQIQEVGPSGPTESSRLAGSASRHSEESRGATYVILRPLSGRRICFWLYAHSSKKPESRFLVAPQWRGSSE